MMWQKIIHILEMIRFSHSIFALPFALLSAVIAWNLRGADGEITTPFHWLTLLGILLCMVTARNTAMSFNRLTDHDVDAQNPRTQGRHIPAGVITKQSVLIFAIINGLLFILSTLLFLPNLLPLLLSIPVLLVLLIYSYTKRFTSLAHFWLGLSLMLAPLSAWIAVRGEILLEQPADILPALIVGVAVLFWVTGFDIIYACQDEAFDRKAKLKSIPVKLGTTGALRLAALCHYLMIGILLSWPTLTPQLSLGTIYYSGVLLIGVLLVIEHLLVKPDDLTRVNIAFFNINSLVSIGLFLIVTIDLLT